VSEDLITVKMDRPIGSTHPDDPAMVYPVNYGYVEGIIAGDGEEQDAYVLGVDVPVDEFTGRKIAVVHRRDDVEDKWIIAPENILFTKQQIEEMINFQEQYFDSYVEILNDEIWDAYDRHGDQLGFDVQRSMAKSLPDGVYHIAVIVYTVNKDGRVLVTQRAKNKTNPLKWEITGGSILKGETPVQGAVRELAEETGLQTTEEQLQFLYNYTDTGRHCIYYGYLNGVNQDFNIRLQEGETVDYQILSYTEFKKLVVSDRFVPSEQRRFALFEDVIDAGIRAQVKE
jgi:8-oxo-dGTP pyrophosphatase MutT (NUDIX family)